MAEKVGVDMQPEPWKATIQGKDLLWVKAHAFHAIVIPDTGAHAFIMSFFAQGLNDTEPKTYTFVVPEDVNNNVKQYLSDMQKLHDEVMRM